MTVFTDPNFWRLYVHQGDRDAMLEILIKRTDTHYATWQKVGDSLSAGGNFMWGLNRHLIFEPCWDYLARTWAWFNQHLGDCNTCWIKTSLSAIAGATISTIITGSPAPLEQEWNVLGAALGYPILAHVLLGTNDIAANDPEGYKTNMETLVGWLTARGCVPIMWTIPPRNDQTYYEARIQEHNAKLMEIIDANGFPWVEYYSPMKLLPNEGLGADNVHPSIYPGHFGWGAGVQTFAGLDYGYNLRGFLAMMILHELRKDLQLSVYEQP